MIFTVESLCCIAKRRFFAEIFDMYFHILISWLLPVLAMTFKAQTILILTIFSTATLRTNQSRSSKCISPIVI